VRFTLKFSVGYVPAESRSELFGGNSNWRGPIWMLFNCLLVESIYEFHRYYGNDFKVKCPAGSGRYMSVRGVADEPSRRRAGILLRGSDRRRPIFGDNLIQQEDPAFRDHLLFHEYIHGDASRGVGASHQTEWSGLIALMLQPLTNGTVRVATALSRESIT